MPVRSPYYQRMHDVLSDGQWHDIREVVTEGARLVPPVHAVHEAERTRINNQRKRTGSIRPRVKLSDRSTLVRQGAWRVAYSRFFQAVYAGHWERSDSQVRLARKVQDGTDA
jgi:hypothetical protein